MDFQKALQECSLLPRLVGETKDAVIEEMIDLLDDAGRLPDRQAALDAVIERERDMSTGMQYGVAIPHGKTDSVPHLVSAVALRPEGLDFDALDGERSQIFVMTLSPLSDSGPHIQYLSQISKLLNQPALRDSLLNAKTEAEMAAVLIGT